MSDLRDFLENIRKHSPKIGEVAMRHVSNFIFIWIDLIFIYVYLINIDNFLLDCRAVSN